MASHLIATIAASTVALAFWWWVYRCVAGDELSGDCWYMRQFAFTPDPISPPYCWRPLLPTLARWFGFGPVSYTATFLTPLALYYYLGGGWVGFAVAFGLIGNRNIFAFNIKNPEYAEGLGQFLLVCSVWAMAADSWLVYPLAFLAVLTRESIGGLLGCIALFVNPFVLLPLAAGGAAAYFTRREHEVNRHPLVESGNYATLKRWMKVKKGNVFHWSITVQPLRGAIFAVPWVWSGVNAFSRLSLVGFVSIWFFSLPASGVSRHVCYGYVLLAPFLAALPGEWLWIFVLLQWFWPIDYSIYDETGGQTFGFAR